MVARRGVQGTLRSADVPLAKDESVYALQVSQIPGTTQALAIANTLPL
jgi:hypothetical protein